MYYILLISPYFGRNLESVRRNDKYNIVYALIAILSTLLESTVDFKKMLSIIEGNTSYHPDLNPTTKKQWILDFFARSTDNLLAMEIRRLALLGLEAKQQKKGSGNGL